ncbi:MAG: nucleotidyltransferase family protein [Deltaproteobacteria bacterium]|nr:nucleotidyltransferase family protein [Deltaproteobacteria bacterium]
MKCIVLAAGYATRLYPLTENFPKPLLDVNGKAILDWLLTDIDSSGMIDEYAVVSNHRYIDHFKTWAERLRLNAPVSVLDDGSVTNETRLGAVKDIEFAIDATGACDDIMIIAGDNLLDFSLSGFMQYFFKKEATSIMRYFEPDAARCSKTGVLTLTEGERVTAMKEKPQNPEPDWCTPPFYIYHRDDLPLIKKAIKENCNTDAPGNLLSYICRHTKVYAMEMPGKRYDIGSLDSYNRVREKYRGIEIGHGI